MCSFFITNKFVIALQQSAFSTHLGLTIPPNIEKI